MGDARFDLEDTYLGLSPDGAVHQLPVGPDFFRTFEDNPALRGFFASAYEMDADWDHWEMHPAGDEVLVLLDGEAVMILEGDGVERRCPMQKGTTLVVPAGAWHRAEVKETCRLLAITFGRGTEHRSRATDAAIA